MIIYHDFNIQFKKFYMLTQNTKSIQEVDIIRLNIYKKPLKTVWPDCKAAKKFDKIDREQPLTQWLT